MAVAEDTELRERHVFLDTHRARAVFPSVDDVRRSVADYEFFVRPRREKAINRRQRTVFKTPIRSVDRAKSF